MKIRFFLLILLSAWCLTLSANKDPEIVILTCSYNNSAYYKQNLESIFKQTYTNWKLYYVDDYSTDGTGQLVENMINRYGFGDKVCLVKNNKRVTALENIYNAIHTMSDKAVVVMLDGDDEFIDESVVGFIANLYQDPNIWLTYGSYVASKPPFPVYCADVKDEYAANNNKQYFFRNVNWCFSHLRTFYAGLFKKIAKEDLLYNGKFFNVHYDLAIMTPMLEMCGGDQPKFKYIDRPLYIYNNENPICDYKVIGSNNMPNYIRALSPYMPLEKLF